MHSYRHLRVCCHCTASVILQRALIADEALHMVTFYLDLNSACVQGYSGEVEYIAAQGPKEETCEDFWNMVLQQNVHLMLMLTQFEENDKVRSVSVRTSVPCLSLLGK
ncbi:hypothetical protein PR048_019083 [Dryococelus australis]|uniref:protein-tyrosine-phosphatase n=1 Tax=Dryococelus australis TaxID=614101 RepID=A0ABQ9H2H5_9NEOP|nr:hypothetical protein PR048_019083 [Dryococelus australis]